VGEKHNLHSFKSERSDSMKHFRITKPTQLIAGLLSGLLFATMAVPLGAQPASESRPGRGFGPVYDAAHETTINGTIREVVTKHALGSPAGMHLLVAGPEGVVDAHVGPFPSKDTLEALHTGLPIQIVGAMERLHGRQYLLARQLIFGGRTVTIRSRAGFLLRAANSRHATSPRALKIAKSATYGGAR
jgi:hypothetical protein